MIERIEEQDGYGDLQARVESERSIDELDQSEGSYSSMQSSQSDSNNSVINKYNSSSSSDTSTSTEKSDDSKSDNEELDIKLKETGQNIRKLSHGFSHSYLLMFYIRFTGKNYH